MLLKPFVVRAGAEKRSDPPKSLGQTPFPDRLLLPENFSKKTQTPFAAACTN